MLISSSKASGLQDWSEAVQVVCTMLPSTLSDTGAFLLFRGLEKNTFALISFLGFHSRKVLCVSVFLPVV